MAAYKFIRGDQQQIRMVLFSTATPGVTRNNGQKLLENRFRLEIRRHYFPVRVARIWNLGKWSSLLPWVNSKRGWTNTCLGLCDPSMCSGQWWGVRLDDLFRSLLTPKYYKTMKL